LETTLRLHPSVNAFISDAFYERRLLTHPSTAGQRVEAGERWLSDAGVRYRAVAHDGNGSSSAEEAELVASAIEALVGRPWVDQHGDRRALTLDDILVVAPYNAHVAAIAAASERRLPPGSRVRVGTVDKFQGQEGAVAIFSMASSSRDDAPRDMEFLYSRNRLN